MSDVPEILWEASLEQKQASHLHRFIQWLQTQKGLTFTDYQALHQWSVSKHMLRMHVSLVIC